MNHYQEAERLLTKADEYVETPRVGVARTYAVMAQAHAALAQVKATRHAANVEEAERWDEGYLQAVLDTTPPGATPEDRLLRAVEFLPRGNPYERPETTS